MMSNQSNNVTHLNKLMKKILLANLHYLTHIPVQLIIVIFTYQLFLYIFK